MDYNCSFSRRTLLKSHDVVAPPVNPRLFPVCPGSKKPTSPPITRKRRKLISSQILLGGKDKENDPPRNCPPPSRNCPPPSPKHPPSPAPEHPFFPTFHSLDATPPPPPPPSPAHSFFKKPAEPTEPSSQSSCFLEDVGVNYNPWIFGKTATEHKKAVMRRLKRKVKKMVESFEKEEERRWKGKRYDIMEAIDVKFDCYFKGRNLRSARVLKKRNRQIKATQSKMYLYHAKGEKTHEENCVAHKLVYVTTKNYVPTRTTQDLLSVANSTVKAKSVKELKKKVRKIMAVSVCFVCFCVFCMFLCVCLLKF
jgi:hypothetical protein